MLNHKLLYPFFTFAEKVAKYLDSLDCDEEGRLSSQQEKRARRTFCHTIHEINMGAHMAGKDGKFQLLVCIGIRYVEHSKRFYLRNDTQMLDHMNTLLTLKYEVKYQLL